MPQNGIYNIRQVLCDNKCSMKESIENVCGYKYIQRSKTQLEAPSKSSENAFN